MTQLVLILDSLRSAANVGSILRTCDAVGVDRVIACGTTPYPGASGGDRDPVVVRNNNRQIAKTALGAEQSVNVEYILGATEAVRRMRAEGRTIYALEQAAGASSVVGYEPQLPAALIVGNEVHGVSPQLLKQADTILEIPQVGAKESLNVAVATGIAAYRLLFP